MTPQIYPLKVKVGEEEHMQRAVSVEAEVAKSI